MTAPTKVDGRKIADEPVVLEKTVPTTKTWVMPTFGKKPAEIFPMLKEQPQLFTWILGTVVATFTTMFGVITWLIMARRRMAARERFLFGKPTRRFGYGRYRLGRFGTAWIAFTYKMPDVRYRLPEMTYKLPTFWEKLPLLER